MSRILCWLLFVLTIFLKMFAEKIFSAFKILGILWFFCYEFWLLLLATTTRRQQPVHHNKQKCQIFSRILKAENMISANIFTEMVKTKSDLHRILANFYLKGFLIEETRSKIRYYPVFDSTRFSLVFFFSRKPNQISTRYNQR